MKRFLIFLHRWTGVALSLLFLLWFLSGIVMLYHGFPSVTRADRLRHAAPLNPTQVNVSPPNVPGAVEVILTTVDGRPAYRVVSGKTTKYVFADDGTLQGPPDQAMLDRVASAWAGRPIADARKESLREVDQWTVAGQLRTLRPLHKYAFSDGQTVYVSGRSAQVVQYTTTSSRLWAWLGAIPHWLYITPIRKHPPAWNQVVVWTSGIATVTAVLGLAIGLWLYSPSRRYSHDGIRTRIPYRGQKRWHTILGLIFGWSAATWAFSGLLSMGPFDLVDRLVGVARPAGNIASALRGRAFRLADYAARTPQSALSALKDFTAVELEFTSVANQPFYLATNSAGETRIVPMVGEPISGFDVSAVAAAIRRAAGSQLRDLRVLREYDNWYRERRANLPLPVVFALLNDKPGTRVYIDPRTAQTVATYASNDWVSRWLYHGLHSLDLPWLYRQRPLWDIVVIGFLLGGAALCTTSLILAWRVLGRKLFAPNPRDTIDSYVSGH